MVWNRTYGASLYAGPYCLVPTRDGGFIGTGVISTQPYNDDVYPFKIDGDENVL